MLVLRRFHNKLVQGTEATLGSGAPTAYELREMKPPLLKIDREISGYLLLAAGAVKNLPLPHNYDPTTERLYSVFRVQGTITFSILAQNAAQASNIIIKGTQSQQGRYSFADFVNSLSIYNPTASDALVQYTCFVLPDLDDSTNYFGLVDQLVTPTSSGGTGEMATTTRTAVQTARIDYSLSPVDTSTWTTLIALNNLALTHITIFDSSGQTLELGVGNPGSESRIMLIPPGGITEDVAIAQGARLAIRGVSGTANVGEIDITTFS